MKNIILHIPHSSTRIPILDGYIVSEDVLKSELLKLTDWYTDDLFQSEADVMVRADFSRIFCDVERFVDDDQEPMSQFGMGVLYERCDNGQPLRSVTSQLRKTIIENYYWKHHNDLKQAVKNQLYLNGKALILDCHSFPDIPLQRSLVKDSIRPDFNLGSDSYHTPKELIDISKDFFEKKGYTLGLDSPYSGSIVPMEFYGKEKKVLSIMLEVNRRLYMNEPTIKKAIEYHHIKTVINEFIDCLRKVIS